MCNINVSGGENIFNINPPTQRELDLETVSTSLTVRLRPKEKAFLEKLAKKRSQPVSAMLRRIIFNHLKIEPRLREFQHLLEDIL